MALIKNATHEEFDLSQIRRGDCIRVRRAGAHVEVDPDNKPEGDSAWFVVYADDIDALEKMYYTFKFRFAPEDTE